MACLTATLAGLSNSTSGSRMSGRINPCRLSAYFQRSRLLPRSGLDQWRKPLVRLPGGTPVPAQAMRDDRGTELRRHVGDLRDATVVAFGKISRRRRIVAGQEAEAQW